MCQPNDRGDVPPTLGSYLVGGALLGMKVTIVKENRWVEQHGPTGINQPRKTETSRPTRKQDQCPFKLNIRLNMEDDLFYLSKKG
jgi:hypothetical protein